MKRITALFLAAVMIVLSAASLTACGNKTSDFKVGVILVGDATEGYTKAHIDGIQAAAKKLGLADSQIEWKYSVPETSDCANAAEDLVDKGCKIVISNSYGHQNYMAEVAPKYPDVTFVAMTGDFAAISGIANLCNAFTKVYESRYVSGVVAGLKLKELLDKGTVSKDATPNAYDADGNIKIGYVGAYPYAEVVSGYTAFFLGIRSVVSNVSMSVQYTKSWFNYEDEKTVANALIDSGCVIIGQHADSTGAPTACEDAVKNGKVVFSVGYNVDMLQAAPTAALTSATNNWEVYYEHAIKTVMDGKKLEQDWAQGYESNSVAITALGKSAAEGTQAKVDEVVAAIKGGTLHVFDLKTFTVGGAAISSNIVDFSYMDFSGATPRVVYQGQQQETVKNGYVEESVLRSAPYFSIRIDGITELNPN
ncbi:MAG: BMP family ABC transporter substrate-binding protein [Lachnospiraceae bacterium]|nr:BMP family ABC transporter substrate-binding protein [Lachnospiraceae bacterium]